MKRNPFYILCFVLSIALSSSLSAKESVKEKLQLVIPKVRFENKDLNFAVKFIKVQSKNLSADDVGLNVIILVKTKKGDKPKLINLDADNMSIAELIQFICTQQELEYVVEKNAILIGNDARLSKLETRFYPMPSSIVGVITDNNKSDFTAFFTSLGVRFPPGAKITYVKKASRLVVTNTANEHAKIAKVFEQFGVSKRR
jgi:hypothetical protein